MECLANHFGYPVGIFNLPHPFTYSAVELTVINFLKRFAILLISRHLPYEDDHRRGILHGGVNADRSVTSAGTARHHCNAWKARHLAIGFSHICGTAFLPTRDCPDFVRRIMQSVNQRQIAFSRHAKHRVHPVYFQGVGKHLSAGSLLGSVVAGVIVHFKSLQLLKRRRLYPGRHLYKFGTMMR